jgi:hypothetical protein
VSTISGSSKAASFRGGFYVEDACSTSCRAPQSFALEVEGWTEEKLASCYWIWRAETAVGVSAARGSKEKMLSRPSGTPNISCFLRHPGLGSAKVAEPSFVAARVGPKGPTYDSWPSHSGLKE